MKVKIDNYEISTFVRTNMMGIKETVAEITCIKKEIYPIVLPLKINNHISQDDILDHVVKYTRKELKEVLENFIKEKNERN